MKCATVNAFGEADDVVRVVEDFPKPELKPGSGKMLVRVLACSTTPGDWRTMSGSTDIMRNPGFPYIPSGDVCGIIEEIDGTHYDMSTGDCIVGSWTETPLGGMAEYAIVDPKLAVRKPNSIDPIKGAALANSAVHARKAVVLARVTNGDRVLVIGASGGVGTILVQLARKMGASYIASVSTDEELMKSLKVNRNINYRQEAWWDIDEFKRNKFDVIFDLAQGIEAWRKCGPVLKTGWNFGRYISVVMDNPRQEFHSWVTLAGFFSSILWRQVWTHCLSPTVPVFKMYLGDVHGRTIGKILESVEKDEIKVVLDPSSPFSFDTKGVQAAYRLQASSHAHGKIVVKIAEEPGITPTEIS